MINRYKFKLLKLKIKYFKARIFDVLLLPFTYLSAVWFRRIRGWGVHNMPLTAAIFRFVKIFPLKNRYYEPYVERNNLDRNFRNSRALLSFNWNTKEQLSILERFNYQEELKEFSFEFTNDNQYYYNNNYFPVGDSEYFYSFIRAFKPNKIVEIGSGYSTLMGVSAINKNKEENQNYICEYTCVEPYKRHWLDTLPVTVIRERIESVDNKFVEELNNGDILFIDSSHSIRPQGDVLHEYLNLLPLLKSGVFVHIHDIFSPHDYPNEWIIDGYSFWNEQYLVEAFMSYNSHFRVIGALNYLFNKHKQAVCEKLPMISIYKPKYLQSFWIVRN